MADPRPIDEESKKDTVRINLPAGVTGRAGVPVPPGPPTQKLKPEDDQKKSTAVMGTPAPQPKRDTSRVQVAAAKPTAPEMPRPTVRLRRDEGAPTAFPTASAPIPVVAPVAATGSAAPSGLEIALACAAIIISLGVVGFAAMTAMN